MNPISLFSLPEHLERLSKDGDPLEVLDATVDFEFFRVWLVEGLGYGDGAKGGRLPFDPVSMFKALILQAQHTLSDAKMEFMIRDRLSWMRFLGFDLGSPTPDENIIRHFRNRLTETGTLKRVMKAFDWQLQKKGYIPMAGQIVDASLVPAPKQRNTEDEKAAIKAGKSAKEIWPNEPNKARQKDTNARWTLKIGGKVRYRPDGTPLPMIAVPVFGYKSHISIDRRFGFIREAMVTSASEADGRQLQHVVSSENTGSEVWADIDLDRSTLADWVGRSTALLEPLADAIGRHVRAGQAIFADDTPIKMQAKQKCATARIWTYVRDERPWGSADPPAAWYRFSTDREGKHPADHLKSFKGWMHADGYSGFNQLYKPDKITEVACMAHVRRKFVDIFKASGLEVAEEAIKRIALLYKVEKDARGKPPEARVRLRQKDAKPVFDDLEIWLEVQLRRISGKSELAKAIRYALGRMPKMRAYLDHGFLELDNNSAERGMRP